MIKLLSNLIFLFFFINLKLNGQNNIETHGFFVDIGIKSLLFIPIDTDTTKQSSEWNSIERLNSNNFKTGFKILFMSDSLRKKIFIGSKVFRNKIVPDDFAENLKYVRIAYAVVRIEKVEQETKKMSKKTFFYLNIKDKLIKLKYNMISYRFTKVSLK